MRARRINSGRVNNVFEQALIDLIIDHQLCGDDVMMMMIQTERY